MRVCTWVKKVRRELRRWCVWEGSSCSRAAVWIRLSHANRLTAFDIAADGSLSNQREWADLDGGVPDSICLDAEGAVWYGDVPNRHCVCVREGGEVLQTID
jgi:sugar lactone lactonase YvrE